MAKDIAAQTLGQRGGKATKANHDPDYYKKLSEKGVKARRKKAVNKSKIPLTDAA